MKTRITLMLAAGLLAASSLRADEAKADLEALQGTWLVVSQQRAGRPLERPKNMKWVIDGDTVWLVLEKGPEKATSEEYKPVEKGRPPGLRLRMTFRLDPGKAPMRIDLNGFGKSASYGIYKLAGDELTVCMGVKCPSPTFDKEAKPEADAKDTRPTTFNPEVGTVIVLKRVKD
jgi:uncharacterized protein (TIGR03067 family)